ncbi:SMI1 / KNR4 family (SUKH-1) [Paenibacillus algorifonticola]|uniref:SMI1 / KNR4 family (SUKH-1) n=1 Tax=Paenibacillus algorifonticola TaxID=684063 RepID=A0A1I2BYV8_9BACL|nr:Imm51 family immunity protein [Paenibacillus algorifonticola]SFE60470.1 SMI1 / KNR4 family (SUKH-1) [Paenibacillus algorifonticola]
MDQQLLAQINLWHEEEAFENIVDRLQEIPEADRNYEIIIQLARALNNTERYRDALHQLSLISEQGKNDPLWHFRQGYAYYSLARYVDALQAFELSRRLDPQSVSTLEFLEWTKPLAEKMVLQNKRYVAESEAAGQNRGTGKDVPFASFDLQSFWEDSDYARKSYVMPHPTAELIASIEQELGYKLPASYIALMNTQNGGVPVNCRFPTEEPTSWSEDHVAITGIMGIGRNKSYTLGGDLGSRFMIEEWGYPDLGIVICDCPSAGHDVIMLDYRFSGPEGEPSVVHVDQEDEYNITYLACSFEAFIKGLVHDDEYDTSAEDKEADLKKVAEGEFSPLLTELCTAVTETDNLEGKIRSICTKITEEKGHFVFHADELSTLMYDLQFWLYTKTYPYPTKKKYVDDYDTMIACSDGEFSTGGYAPAFITDWLDNRIQLGKITVTDRTLSMTNEAIKQVIEQLNAYAAPANKALLHSDADGITAQLQPFIFIDHDNKSWSVILNAGTYKQALFDTRAYEGFEGSGYDWSSLAAVFLEEKMPELAQHIHFDPEAGMFCVYSSNREALVKFALAFKAACEDHDLISDLFTRAELD